MIEILRCKIHRATVTDANLNYVGSITISRELMDAAHLYEYQKVQIVNINNGQRFETYVIAEEKELGCICLNGAAARLALTGDKVIIMAYDYLEEQNVANHRPTIVHVDERNRICE